MEKCLALAGVVDPLHIENVDSCFLCVVFGTRALREAAYADLKNSVSSNQTLFNRPANRCAVMEPLPQGTRVSCVRMSVKLDHSELEIFFAGRAKDRQEHGMIYTYSDN